LKIDDFAEPKIILGTANFGTVYGVANKGIKLDEVEALEIIETAQNLGINDFDTASTYGVAESLLGQFLNQHSQPKISSKISKEDSNSVKKILESVNKTLLRLKVSRLDNIYLPDPDELTGGKAHETISGLNEVIALGLANRVGASVYTLESLLRAKQIFPGLTVFQIPENICDRRMHSSTELLDLQNQGNQLIVRSLFLQGLLLMSPEEIASRMKVAKKPIIQLKRLANSYNLLPFDLCLAYARSIPWADGIILGVANASHLRQAINSRETLPIGWESIIDTLPLEILDPRLW